MLMKSLKALVKTMKSSLFVILACWCIASTAQTTATQTITTAWGNYITTNIQAYGNTLLQVRIDGQNSRWQGVFSINGDNSWTPDITWNNVKLISFSGYNSGTDDIQALIMSNSNPTTSFGGTIIVLKAGSPASGVATMTVVATGQNAGSLSLSGYSSTAPYTYTMATSAGTYNMWTVNNKVGIGTIAPKTLLDLGELKFDKISSFPAEGSVLEGDWGNYIIGDLNLQRLRFGVSNDRYTKAEIFLDNSNRQDGSIALKTSSGGVGAITRLFVNGEGSVGIGTASPEAKLHVEGRSYIRTNDDDVLTFDNTDDSWQYIQFKGNGVRKTWMGLDNYNNFNIYKEKGGAILFGGGNVGIGTSNVSDPDYRLFVETGIRTRKVKVDQTNWADYVFEPAYRLLPLIEVERFIKQNKHLPEVPTAKEVEKNGVDLGENQVLLLKKIEELTLYAIESEKLTQDLKIKNQKQQELINLLEERLKKLEDKLK